MSKYSTNHYRAYIGGEKPTGNGPKMMRYLTGAHQVYGMSGSCVLNGYGIAGVATEYAGDYIFAGNTSNNLVIFHQGLMVQWIDVYEFIILVQTYHNFTPCNSTVVISPPNLLNWFERKVDELIAQK